MHLILSMRLPFSDHAQDLREALFELTGHDISERLELTTLRLCQAILDHWHLFDESPELLHEAIGGTVGRFLPHFNLNFATYQQAVATIAAYMGRLRNDMFPFFDGVLRSLEASHQVSPLKPDGPRTYRVEILKVSHEA